MLAPAAPPTALVVDDDAATRNLARLVLLTEGFDVLEAPGGAEALRVAAAHPGPIRLLVTDLHMPGMDGRELAQRFRALRPDLRVLTLSGDPGAEVDGPFLAKPFSLNDLAQKVREALGG